MQPKTVWLGDGGNNPTWDTQLAFVSKIRIESSATLHSSELIVECGRYGSTPIEWQCIRVYDPDIGSTLFFGRIDNVRPIYSESRGMMWRIHARDFMQTLTDNLVAHKQYHPWWGSYLPNWRVGCVEGQEPGTGECGMLRGWIVRDLAIGVRNGFTSMHDGGGTYSSGEYISPNYLDCAGMSIYEAVLDLAEGHPHYWDHPSWGVGYDFRQGFSEQPPRFDYFQKSSIMWDSNKLFQWHPYGTPPNYIPVLSYDAEKEGYAIYSRAIAHGHGNFIPHGQDYIAGLGWRHWGGMADPVYGDIRLAGMDSIWNPPTSYNIQREAFAHDESIQDSKSLQTLCLSKLRSDSIYKGTTAATFAVGGIPLNSSQRPPLPGDRIWVSIPGISTQGYTVDKWVYEEPPGISYFTIGRRPQSDVSAQVIAERRARHQDDAAVEACWTSWWWATEPGDHFYYFTHNLGVVPSTVRVHIAEHSGANTHWPELSLSDVDNATVTEAPTMHADPVSGQWVGYQISEITRDRIGIYFANWLGYSDGKASSEGNPDGWCQLGNQTAFSISLEP